MEKLFPLAFAAILIVVAGIFTGSIISNYRHSNALGQCMAKGYTKAEVTISGTFCRKWTVTEGEIVVPLN
jgi:hypothetical protein